MSATMKWYALWRKQKLNELNGACSLECYMTTISRRALNQIGDSLDSLDYSGDEAHRLRGILGDTLLVLRGDAQIIKRKDLVLSRLGNGKQQLKSWVRDYKKAGIAISASEVIIPPKPQGLDRLIVVPNVMKSQAAFELCQKSFPCWKLDEEVSLDKLDQSPRNADNGAYAIWVRDRVEADEELKNRSYDQLQSQSVNIITLCERLLLEWDFFNETGEHLDIENVTLTSSLRSRGGVFRVRCSGSRLKVDYHDRDDYRGHLRAREAVSRA